MDETQRQALVEAIANTVENASKAMLTERPREHLGASVIGDECARKLWYAWRWVVQEEFSGRVLRLFERGKLEETRFHGWLVACGFVFLKTPTVAAIGGHFGGTPDGIVMHNDWPNIKFIVEFKTYGTRPFVQLKQSGMKTHRPQHWAQMCVYGLMNAIEYGIYCAVNKNDDELHFEVHELDHQLAGELYRKATNIIEAQSPPDRLPYASLALFACKYCPAKEICLADVMPTAINCRSCRFATAVPNGWYCNKHNGPIPPDFVAKGCPDWVSIA